MDGDRLGTGFGGMPDLVLFLPQGAGDTLRIPFGYPSDTLRMPFGVPPNRLACGWLYRPFTHLPKWPIPGEAAFCLLSVSLGAITVAGGGRRRPREDESYLR